MILTTKDLLRWENISRGVALAADWFKLGNDRRLKCLPRKPLFVMSAESTALRRDYRSFGMWTKLGLGLGLALNIHHWQSNEAMRWVRQNGAGNASGQQRGV